MDNLLIQVAAMAATAGVASAGVAALFLFGRKAKEEVAEVEISLEEGLAALRQVISDAAIAEAAAVKAEAEAAAAVAKATAAREAAVAAAAKAADAQARIQMMEEALRA